MTKLWQKDKHHLHDNVQKKIEAFTVGSDKTWDLYLAEFDVQGSLAHAAMLESVGLLKREEFAQLEVGLKEISTSISEGNFVIEDGVEDVHSQIEILLTRHQGEVGKKIHSGRSRNDQALLDIKLYTRHEIKVISSKVKALFESLINLSERYKDVLLPGYTHMQIAMPSSFGLWFGAYAESLSDDLEMLIAAYKVANKNPLGSGAGYGSSFPLNRQMTTEWLQFESMNYNVVYAQMTRGKSEKITAMALAGIAATLSRFSMDVCLYMNQNFGFISFPDELTTGSSIMPHKKNPDVFELVRAKCNRIQALPNELTLLTNNLPSGYHRDMQLTKDCLFPAIIELKNCLEIVVLMLESIIVNEDILSEDKYQNLFTVEAVNRLVLSGIPFREAYKTIGLQVESGTFHSPTTVEHVHDGSIGQLCNDKIREAFLVKMDQLH